MIERGMRVQEGGNRGAILDRQRLPGHGSVAAGGEPLRGGRQPLGIARCDDGVGAAFHGQLCRRQPHAGRSTDDDDLLSIESEHFRYPPQRRETRPAQAIMLYPQPRDGATGAGGTGGDSHAF
jgi:hypothetical protein